MCLAASQARIFPIGFTNNGLVVFETHMGRGENFRDKNDEPEMKPYWGGYTYLKVYDRNHKVISSVTLDTLRTFKEADYEKVVSGVYTKAVKIAEAYKGFKPVKPTAITFADYQLKCSLASIEFDTIRDKIEIRLKNKTRHPVTVLRDTASIASNLISYFTGFETSVTAKDLKNSLAINSVRQFKADGKKLTIVHLGTGNGVGGNGKEYEAKFAFNDISKSIFFEPVLHHGHGFDFIIWE